MYVNYFLIKMEKVPKNNPSWTMLLCNRVEKQGQVVPKAEAKAGHLGHGRDRLVNDQAGNSGRLMFGAEMLRVSGRNLVTARLGHQGQRTKSIITDMVLNQSFK